MYLAPSKLANLMVPAIRSLFLTRIRNVQFRYLFYAGYWERIRHTHIKKNLYLFKNSLQPKTYLLSLVWILTILCLWIRYRIKVHCFKSINKHLRYLSPSKLNIPLATITHYVSFFRIRNAQFRNPFYDTDRNRVRYINITTYTNFQKIDTP